MKITVLILGIFIACPCWAGHDDVYTVSGTNEIPGESPVQSQGTASKGQGSTDERRKANNKKADEMPMFCKIEGTCPGATLTPVTWQLWKPSASSLEQDCQRACRNPCLAKKGKCTLTCSYSVIENGVCKVAQSALCDPSTIVNDGNSAIFAPAPSADECPAGIPQPGLPEDDMSGMPCMVADKECVGEDVRVTFEASIRGCKSTFIVNTWAMSALYDKERRCHLRRERCSTDNMVPYTKAGKVPGISQEHAYTFTRRTTEERKADEPCPAGGAPFNPPEEPFHDAFCEWPGHKCDMPPETDMYHLMRRGTGKRGYIVKNNQKCKDKCSNLAPCGSMWTEKNAKGALFCIMQRDETCPPDKIVSTDNPDNTLFLRIRKDQYSEDEVKDNLDKICSELLQGEPTFVPWSQSFCGFKKSSCDGTVLQTVPELRTYQSCLTACVQYAGGACKGANLDNNGCTLLSSDCIGSDVAVTPGSKYFRTKAEGEECHFPEEQCEQNYREKICYSQNVFNSPGADFQARCQVGNAYLPTNSQATFLSEDCKKKQYCEHANNDGEVGPAKLFDVDSSSDSLCEEGKQCVNVEGFGFCGCPQGQTMQTDGACA